MERLGGIYPIDTYYRFGEHFTVKGIWPIIAMVAGRVMLRQQPPTAKGVMFLTVEDETGFLQCVVRPDVLERLDKELRHAALIVRGTLSISGHWRGLVLTHARPLDHVLGGYHGHPNNLGGRDILVRSTASALP